MSYGDHLMSDAVGLIIPGLRIAELTLTDAQIKALPSTPIPFGEAPGGGNRIKILGVTLVLDSTAGAYTNIDASYAEFSIYGGTFVYGPVDDSSATPIALTLFSSFFGVAGHNVYDIQIPGLESSTYPGAFGYAIGNVIQSYASQSGAQMNIHMINGAGDLTGGNAANSLYVRMYYLIEPMQ